MKRVKPYQPFPDRVLGEHAYCPSAGTVIYVDHGRHGCERICNGCGQSSHRGKNPIAPETVDEVHARIMGRLEP